MFTMMKMKHKLKHKTKNEKKQKAEKWNKGVKPRKR